LTLVLVVFEFDNTYSCETSAGLYNLRQRKKRLKERKKEMILGISCCKGKKNKKNSKSSKSLMIVVLIFL